MPGIESVEDFTTRYGFSPQEYFNRVVKNDANPHQLVDLEARLAKAEAAVAATKGWESLQPGDAFYAGANAENELTAVKQLVQAALWHQTYAKQFLAGTLADYGPFLGREGQELKKLGWIDTTLVPAA
jgi:hypothetical protein